ncbi:binding-protein-dependent transport systems inner membrane component [Beutenbergia cavernae DSM 12333]|uniref:Binding-protein-dependent transport systems inner membrane component n=1 Tax=Beutenbergia cavernae (strain ATCC BAA-8 / DSM 12333 / CCUG 43141 / JCM 11478 / NBRC 16432 / NCIMB 13614 / HKI 0122) TaxID=471853 RepID=C5C4L5_BEUC1|nr:carbohydrate ABC transporter permease [Beutenbergia cavernae]ACQ82139.1 binding-protein-dependent transport systems inner membrane component [Beutenbergia cavernae DSM 12333]
MSAGGPRATAIPATGLRSRRVVTHAVLILGALVMIYPLLWMLSASFKEPDQIFTSDSLIPQDPVLTNYLQGWVGLGRPFSTYLLNSLLVCAAVVVGNVLSCSLAAYAFARMSFVGRKVLFGVMLATMMLPHHVTLIAQYAIFRDLGWVDTYLPLIVPKFLAVEAFFIFLMVQFIRGLPRELDDAARIDGCGQLQIYWRVVFPLLQPALVTTAIFSFIWTYNDFLTQLIYVSDPKLLTVPLALRTFLDASGQSQWGEMFAMSIVTLVPVLVVFVVFQRRIIDGIAHSGMK